MLALLPDSQQIRKVQEPLSTPEVKWNERLIIVGGTLAPGDGERERFQKAEDEEKIQADYRESQLP